MNKFLAAALALVVLLSLTVVAPAVVLLSGLNAAGVFLTVSLLAGPVALVSERRLRA